METKKTTCEQVVVDRINEVGYIDNFWCIDNRITTRLGAVIHRLTKGGWSFRRTYGDNAHRKNSYYYPILKPGETQMRII